MNMFKGLLFLHGHFTRPEDLDESAVVGRTAYGARTAADDFARPLGNRAASAAWFGPNARRPVSEPNAAAPTTRNVPSIRKAQAVPSHEPRTHFLDHLLYLGGRPMHAGHNFDVAEPFEQAARADTVRQTRRTTAQERSAPSAIPHSQTCNG